MPKSFSFYNSEHHQKIISLLEEKKPSAIVTIVDNDISIFEDGDFDIPSVYVTKEVLLKEILVERENFELIEPWVEGDHILFLMNQIPAIALTSKNIFDMIDSIIHTERDFIISGL